MKAVQYPMIIVSVPTRQSVRWQCVIPSRPYQNKRFFSIIQVFPNTISKACVSLRLQTFLLFHSEWLLKLRAMKSLANHCRCEATDSVGRCPVLLPSRFSPADQPIQNPSS